MAKIPAKEGADRKPREVSEGLIVTAIEGDHFKVCARVNDAKAFRKWVKEEGEFGVPYAFVRQSDKTITKTKVERTSLSAS